MTHPPRHGFEAETLQAAPIEPRFIDEAWEDEAPSRAGAVIGCIVLAAIVVGARAAWLNLIAS